MCLLGAFIFRADTENTEVAKRNQSVSPNCWAMPTMIFRGPLNGARPWATKMLSRNNLRNLRMIKP